MIFTCVGQLSWIEKFYTKELFGCEVPTPVLPLNSNVTLGNSQRLPMGSGILHVATPDAVWIGGVAKHVASFELQSNQSMGIMPQSSFPPVDWSNALGVHLGIIFVYSEGTGKRAAVACRTLSYIYNPATFEFAISGSQTQLRLLPVGGRSGLNCVDQAMLQ
jgi:hypothetical protein